MMYKIIFLCCILLLLLFIQSSTYKESFTSARPCRKGYFCPPGVQNDLMKCPRGTYGDRDDLQTSACSGICRAGCVCEAGSTSECPALCPKGYKCKRGTMTFETDIRYLEPWTIYPTPCGEWVAIKKKDKNNKEYTDYEWRPCPAGTPDLLSFDGSVITTTPDTRPPQPKEEKKEPAPAEPAKEAVSSTPAPTAIAPKEEPLDRTKSYYGILLDQTLVGWTDYDLSKKQNLINLEWAFRTFGHTLLYDSKRRPFINPPYSVNTFRFYPNEKQYIYIPNMYYKFENTGGNKFTYLSMSKEIPWKGIGKKTLEQLEKIQEKQSYDSGNQYYVFTLKKNTKNIDNEPYIGWTSSPDRFLNTSPYKIIDKYLIYEYVSPVKQSQIPSKRWYFSDITGKYESIDKDPPYLQFQPDS